MTQTVQPSTEHFGQFLKKRMEERGEKQDTVAAELDVDQSSVSRWIGNDAPPKRATLEKLALYLDFDPEPWRLRLHGKKAGHEAPAGQFVWTCRNIQCRSNRVDVFFRSFDDAYVGYVWWKSQTIEPADRYDRIAFCPTCGMKVLKCCPNPDCVEPITRINQEHCMACGTKVAAQPSDEQWHSVIELEFEEDGEVLHQDDPRRGRIPDVSPQPDFWQYLFDQVRTVETRVKEERRNRERLMDEERSRRREAMTEEERQKEDEFFKDMDQLHAEGAFDALFGKTEPGSDNGT
jgi:transcriptional regulator with XRE-family HTH domain